MKISYGMKIEADSQPQHRQQDGLMSSPYNDHQTTSRPESDGCNNGSNSGTGSNNSSGEGRGSIGNDYESSSLIYKALSEACNGSN